MDPDALVVGERELVFARASPPVESPEEDVIWMLANYVFNRGLKFPPKSPTMSDITWNITTYVRAFCDTTARMWNPPRHSIPTSLGKVVFPYIYGLKTGFTLGIEAPVRVAPSNIHGKGVFATRDIKANELFTTYPVHALRVLLDRYPDGGRGYVYMYKDLSIKCRHADDHWEYYKMGCDACFINHWEDLKKACEACTTGEIQAKDITEAAVIYGNPNVHPPEACGHMINDPRGTGRGENCGMCLLVGGVVTAIIATEAIKKGEELLFKYGEGYWAS
eukprot:130592-Prymnesium_polylepis.1